MTKIDNFICLAQIDEKIKDIEASKGDLPLRIDKIEKKKVELVNSNEILSNDNIEIDKEKNKLKNNKELSEAKLEKYKDQLFLVKNNKEYDALNSEIDLMKDEIFQINEKLNSLNSNIQNNDETLKASISKIEEYQEKLNKLNNMLEESMKDEQNDYDSLKKERQELIPKLDEKQFKSYSQMFVATGFGMVPLTSGACSNCYTVLPAQLVTEIKLKEEFKNCPSCNILLYHQTDLRL